MSKYAGWIIFGTLVFFLLSVKLPFLLILPTISAWLVPVVMWQFLGKSSRKQTLWLLIIGLAALFFSAGQGIYLGWRQIFAANLPLLAMFVAVSFLTLTSSVTEGPALPNGKKAVITTAIGTHLLGAVINLSAVFLFGDRLQRNGSLSKVQMIILARSFCAAAWWSPFFIATGVALIYAPDMSWKETLIPGAVMSIIAISYSTVEVCFFSKARFSGYPLKTESLAIPLFLAAVVIGVHHFRHDINVLVLICLLAPAGALLFMKGRPRLPTLRDFIDNRISTVSSQFALFLATGVFSTGIKSITHVYPAVFTLEGSFTPLMFAIILGAMILIGIVGVHPVVSIAIVSPLLLPLDPDHSQLGFLFLTSWAVSTASSPLSGVGLALVSRFKASPKVIIQSNWRYALVMWAIASMMNILFFVGSR
ncbi:hypothetical protein [Desulfopila inferna]|uniref:hypothetical protein n=1 Tax=Desulfopila inferna TaxID=468528 RepID=UPI001964BDC7|nr:hypothetical protein [Desulfopila inferna]MBM9603750.1 hypothetical protein [Desulfopila inferna]